jgi:VIT1/CCC1 family predicted Fe2+/Mn2+ transporter
MKFLNFRRKRSRIDPDYLRNIIFGAEDSLVSTVGVLFGLASSGAYSSRQLVLAGLVLTCVEALSMGVGSYLSEAEIHERDPKNHKDNLIVDGLIMFTSYFVSGLIILGPYMVFSPTTARYYSVILSLILLFMIGYLPSLKLKSGVKMLLLAGGSILVGYIIGVLFNV